MKCCSSTTAAATARRRCSRTSSCARPDVTRVILFNANYGQHMAIVAGFEHCRGERIVTLDADLQNPPEEIGKLLARDGRRPRLRRRRAPHARGFMVATRRLEGDEPRSRAHHPHQDDRPGLHAARVQPRHRARGRRVARGQHLHSGARLYLCAQSDRGRGRARGARGRRVEIFALQAHAAEFRPHHRIFAGAAADVLDVRHAGVGRRGGRRT